MNYFYHVDQSQELHPLREVDYYKSYDDCDLEIIKYCKSHFPEGLSTFGIEYTAFITPKLEEYKKYVVEIFLETYRQKHFPEKPSRFQSLHCAPSIRDAKIWANRLHLKLYNIIEVSSSTYHQCDSTWREILEDHFNIAYNNIYAHHYWSGAPHTGTPKPEVLVKLPVKVNKIISTVDEIIRPF